jgi:hypothetical protein
VNANGTASHSLVADFLSQAHDDADEDMLKAVAFIGYMGKSFFQEDRIHLLMQIQHFQVSWLRHYELLLNQSLFLL